MQGRVARAFQSGDKCSHRELPLWASSFSKRGFHIAAAIWARLNAPSRRRKCLNLKGEPGTGG